MLRILVLVLGLGVVVAVAVVVLRARRRLMPRRPYVTFDGGDHYLVLDKHHGVDLGEGVFRALADELRRRGVTIHEIGQGPGCDMRCGTEDGTVKLSIMPALDGNPWSIVIYSEDNRVPPFVGDALATLAHLRNIRWHAGESLDRT